MPGRIEVTTQDLRNLRNDIINQLAPQYEQKYTALYRRMDDMKSTWKGIDIDAYLTRIEGFRKEFQTMKQIMDQYGAYLLQSAEAYEATQEDIKNRANQLVNGG